MVPALVALALSVGLPLSASAMVGGAPLAPAEIARHIVLIVGSRGNSCTGVAIAPDIVLTGAHCVLPGFEYKWVDFDAAGAPTLHDIATIARHPEFNHKTYLNSRVTADIALIKLARPLPPKFAPATLAPDGKPPAIGDRLLVVGYGVTVPDDGRTGGKIRTALLTVTGRPGTLQVRLVDPATNNARPGLGACEGDSGAPVFDVTSAVPLIVGVVSWATAPRSQDGCGGLTGVTPLVRYRAWIIETAARLRGRLPSM
jgi:secreted trypsin-like serine protease